jgi:hypothetical protein
MDRQTARADAAEAQVAELKARVGALTSELAAAKVRIGEQWSPGALFSRALRQV